MAFVAADVSCDVYIEYRRGASALEARGVRYYRIAGTGRSATQAATPRSAGAGASSKGGRGATCGRTAVTIRSRS